ncbi:MAG: polysaccharide deacetylase family protein [Bacillota bacterium]
MELNSKYLGIFHKYGHLVPKEWGELVTGVKTRLNTYDKVIALTFDACGQGGTSNGYDKKLIQFLLDNDIPATLFISGLWMKENIKTFIELSTIPLFEIQNHGLRHRPCSVNGRSIYGIQGTSSIYELIQEVEFNAKHIFNLTGKKTLFYRPGTAYCDEISVKIINDLGYHLVNFNVLGDKGATFDKNEVRRALINAESGSIIICHMNHPESETSLGVTEAIPILLNKGYRFVKLSDYPLI